MKRRSFSGLTFWNRDRNWDPLWDAIETLAQKRLAGSPMRPHFLGTVVLDQFRTPPGRVHARQIIDGQQRLTTLQLAARRNLLASVVNTFMTAIKAGSEIP